MIEDSQNTSILQKRWQKFKSLKRGYYSLIILSSLYILSFLLPVLINNKAIIVKYNDNYYFPILTGYIPGKTFGQDVPGEAKYRPLKKRFDDSESNNWLILPPYPYSPYEDITSDGNKMYEPPMGPGKHWLGTDDTGRDVFARLLYAFNISITFALILTVINSQKKR